MNQDPTKEQIDRLIESALQEDLGSGDITTRGTVDDKLVYEAEVVARESMVVCGLGIFKSVFTRLDAGVTFPEQPFKDGDTVSPGAVVLKLKGRAVALLEGERVALNILQRLCGIATQTRRFVDHAGSVEVLDTRKTTPGLRVFEKYAVRCGGGKNHRFGLFDAILIKDNHIKAAGGIGPAVERVRSKGGSGKTVEVEAVDLGEVKEALDAGADTIMLDNMQLDAIREAVRVIDGKARIEVSGRVTLDRLEALSQTGIDCVSVGALTHSPQAADISMNFLETPS
ncbi:MAG: carboxylating nicotinate-nucleotide diphosphorylase [Nitrospinae bacterium]|nr:carboxylating nicotinate-nucleotide diphosphorylase [Nitrospinota bacterium]